jgi:glycerol-3-phosphate dehydrogenase
VKEFSYRIRSENLAKLQNEMFDLAIIGGGISGAGAARDAASRGMKVALIEANDFAFGTSSRSSKLIHGGIRYLENREFKLVFEALSERRLLFEIAPHLVHPLRFVLPLYEGDRVGPFLMGIGMWLYDALALFEVPEMHKFLRPAAALERVPHLKENGLRGSFIYSDAYMDDDRLVLETLRSANELGATLCNYVTATDAEMSDGKVRALVCRDEQTRKSFKINARHFVSTVGPWTDRVGSTLLKTWKKILRPSKGVHVIIPKNRLPVGDAVVMSTRTDKRIVFVIPRHEMVIVGTTDTDYPGDPAFVHTDKSDINYIVKILGDYFPSANITEKDFISSYAGVRPLVADDASTESATSREHIIINDPRGVTFVAGGKYTTYRLMGKQTVDAALMNFSGDDKLKFARNNTKIPLNSKASPSNLERARAMTSRWSEEYGFDEGEINLLVERHALEAKDLLARGASLKAKSIWELEAHHAIDHTMCLSLRDFYIRRVPLFLNRPDHGLSLAPALLQVFAARLGWSSAECETQLNAIHEHIRLELSWQNT